MAFHWYIEEKPTPMSIHFNSTSTWSECSLKCLPWFNLDLDAVTLQGQCFRLAPLWLVREWSWKFKVTHHVWSLCHLTSRQFKTSIAGVVCMFHYVSLPLKHLFFLIVLILIWMHLIVLPAMIGKVPAEWFGSGPRWHSLIDTLSEQPADVIGARDSPSLQTGCPMVRRKDLLRMISLPAYHALWLDRMSNSSIPKKEIEKGDGSRATTVHSLAFPILMSWPCGRRFHIMLSQKLSWLLCHMCVKSHCSI